VTKLEESYLAAGTNAGDPTADRDGVADVSGECRDGSQLHVARISCRGRWASQAARSLTASSIASAAPHCSTSPTTVLKRARTPAELLAITRGCPTISSM